MLRREGAGTGPAPTTVYGVRSLSTLALSSAAVNAGSEQRVPLQANAAGLSRSGNSTSELGSGPSARSHSSTRLYAVGSASAAASSSLERGSARGPTTVM